MKSNEVYRQLRQDLGLWFKSSGFKRGNSMLSWVRQIGDAFIVVWFQVSQFGFEPYSGSQFIVEFQKSSEPIVGSMRGRRKRISGFLSEAEREDVRKIQNQVIEALRKPPEDYVLLRMQDALSERYRRNFEPIGLPYPDGSDIWFRYATPADVSSWSSFIRNKLPDCITEIEAWA
jgi:hypothetical protein